MKCHQILTGAVNSGDNTYSAGSVEGIHFTAYCSGCNIVILSARFERVQIVPGVLHGGNVQANCIDASTDVGKIAACYGGPIKCHQQQQTGVPTPTPSTTSNRIFIYEPTPIIGQVSEHRLDYSWIKTAEIKPNSPVSVLSWNIEGTRLLTGGVEIQLWQLSSQQQDNFAGKLTPTPSSADADQGLRMKPLRSTSEQEAKKSDWSCVWSCKTSSPVCHLSFSPDGTLFCSTGRSDRLVKIWFEAPTQSHHFTALFDQQQQSNSTANFNSINNVPSAGSLATTSGHGNSNCSLSFSFIYIAHPRAVTGISWRHVSKYMPRGSVANMLVTSCRDNICRLWVQTLLPEDGLVNVSQLEGVGSLVTPREQTARHRQKFISRIKSMKSFTNFKRRQHVENEHGDEGGGSDGLLRSPSQEGFGSNSTFNPNLPSTFSVHDFHGFGVHGTAVAPGGLHFHLTATINAENDIPLVPSLTAHPSESNLPAAAAAQGPSAGHPKVSVTNEEPRATSPSSGAVHSHHGGQAQGGYHHHEESDKPLFVVNWLNNKEMAYTQGAERILHEIVANIIESERQALLQQQLQLQQQQQQQEESETASNNTENTAVENVQAGKTTTAGKQSSPPKGAPSTPGAKSTASEHLAEFVASSHNSSSTNSLATMTGALGAGGLAGGTGGELVNRRTVADYLDRKLESLMRDWHTTSDLLYSIHPLDGSLLVWLVEWLDEPTPSTFRQPQISFSARIPNSIPLWDASTMSHHIRLYSPHCFLDLKSVLQCSTSPTANPSALINAVLNPPALGEQGQGQAISLAHKSQQAHYQSQQPLFGTATGASSTLCMVTKHNNGSLNLWNLFFAETRSTGPSAASSAAFTQVLSLAHAKRVCGHRFRVNDVSCHPILPLLLTTSHHNSPTTKSQQAQVAEQVFVEVPGGRASVPNSGFCSELILWKVDSVGPLLKSGGVTELARINSLESTAFANVAWVPTLLPSTALGAGATSAGANSPSACFVASDGRQLRIYQAVIDARSLLAEAQRYMLNINDQRRFYYDSSEDEDEDYGDDDDDVEKSVSLGRFRSPSKSQEQHRQRYQSKTVDPDAFRSLFKIVSLQSTARPGAVLELSPIVDARQDWAKTQLLHVFQEQLVLGNQIKGGVRGSQNSGSGSHAAPPEITLPDGGRPVIDLPFGGDHTASCLYEEVFYLVVVEKTGTSSTLHMWRITISSRGSKASLDELRASTMSADDGDSSRSVSPDFASGGAHHNHGSPNNNSPLLRIKTRKVTTQVLPLPQDVEVIHAAPAAGHLSSSNIYPACYAPFLLTTACSDNKVRFWRCQVDEDKQNQQIFTWLEWQMHLKMQPKTKKKSTTSSMDLDTEDPQLSSALELPGSPLYVACAYSGRIAAAFKYGHSYQADSKTAADSKRFLNIGIAIYECQSSGGSDWILEDTIKVERIPLLEQGALDGVLNGDAAESADFDLAPLVDKTLKNHQASLSLKTKMSSSNASNPFLSAATSDQNHSSTSFGEIGGEDANSNHRVANIQRLLAVPSYTTIQSLRRLIAEQGNQCTFTQKSPVLLDWVSTEDGTHLLTCSAGHKVALFAPVSQRKAMAQPLIENKPVTTSTVMLIPQQSFSGGSTSPSNFARSTSYLGGDGPMLNNSISVTKWMVLRVAELASVDGLPPLPMQLSWVRDGILVVGMDNEMLIFTQWKRTGTAPHLSYPSGLAHMNFQSSEASSGKQHQQARPLAVRYPFDSVDLPTERFVAASSNLGKTDASAVSEANTEKIISGEHQPDDYGFFEAYRLSSPVIPQYHPRQLMELLAFGKIHRVRAILSHLVASLCSIGAYSLGKEYLHHHPAMNPHGGSSFENDARSPRAWTRTRALSIAQQPSPHEGGGSSVSPMDSSHSNNPIVAEEIQLDYTEIASIRPLPLYALLQADEGISSERTKALEEAKVKAKNAAAASKSAVSSSAFTLDGAEALDADSLFEDVYSYKTQVEETLDEFLGNRTAFNFSNLATSKFLKSGDQGKGQTEQFNENELQISISFDQRQAGLLSKLLTHSHLPGLSSLDQMHLLALADSLASFSDLADKQQDGNSLNSANSDNLSSDYPAEDGLLTISANSLDDCGLRYLLNMRQHVYLLRCLPLMQRKALQASGLGLHNIIWAFHSETQEELVQLVTTTTSPTTTSSSTNTAKSITWADLREVGVGYWVRNNALLRKVIERLAKAAFKARNDPLDAALYYMAMRKKNLVWGLYRSVQDRKMTEFFSHDFSEDKWRKAALKNAYALMGKQRFEHAVAFFLLAGSLWDAVEVCLNRLDDLQLAMVIVRLYDGGDIETVPETLKKMLHEEILGYRKGAMEMDRTLAHPDPFLRSMAYWMLHEYNLALSTLLEVGDVGSRHPKTMDAMNNNTGAVAQVSSTNEGASGSNFEGLHPAVFNFYLYLRTQPLIVRRAQVAQHNISTTAASSSAATKKSVTSVSKKSHMFSGATNRADAVAITVFERRLFFLTAHRHLRAGCPALALEVLSRLPANILSYSEKNELEECSRRMSLPDHQSVADDGHLPGTKTASLMETKPAKAEDLFGGGGGFDWGAPASSLFTPKDDEEEFKITFDDDDEKKSDEEDDEDEGLLMKEPEKTPSEPDAENAQTKIDVMAQQFKFIACLKILMEELSTLATGFEVDGGQLRYQLYIWLERSVTVLKETVHYHTFSLRSTSTSGRAGSIDHSLTNVGLVPQPQPSSSVLVNTSSRNLHRKPSDNSGQGEQQPPPPPSLHEILLADKVDFESKMERCRRRKNWLLANEALLRNLLSYCSLHGAHGGGLASVRMELILLLQELQQDRTPQQQLLSPLPLPTTLPLLTASVASQKTVVADPIRYLQSTIHDILGSLTEIATYVHMPTRSEYAGGSMKAPRELLALPPFMVSGTATALTAWATSLQQLQGGAQQNAEQQQHSYASSLYSMVHILRDLGISLSACVYQSLCDCDTVMQNCAAAASSSGFGRSRLNNKKRNLPAVGRGSTQGINTGEAGASTATSGATTADTGNEPLVANTPPSKWPGVQSLQAMIVREKDEDLPKLHTLLCEAFVAVYLSQLVYALTICDSGILFRLIGLKFTDRSWADLFGGGAKKLLYVSTASVLAASGLTGATSGLGGSPSPNELLNGAGAASGSSGAPHIDLLNTLSKQRMKLHMKILEQLNQAQAAAVAAGAAAAEAVSAVSTGMVNVATSPSSTFTSLGNQFSGSGGAVPGSASTVGVTGATEQRPTYRELFVPPQVSLVNYLMMKPELPSELVHLDYDSNASEGEEDADDDDGGIGGKFKSEKAKKDSEPKDDDEIDDEEYDNWANDGRSTSTTATKTKIDLAAEKRKANLEYDLYAWCIIRLAVSKLAYEQLDRFLSVSGLEKGDLPTTSPAIHSILKMLKRWQYSLAFYMNEFTHLPDRFLPNMYVDAEKTSGPVIAKYKSLLETNNTPFRGSSGGSSLKASKRLWNYLVRQKSVQDIFIRYIYAKSKSSKLARDHGATAICNSLSGSALNESGSSDGVASGTSEGDNKEDGGQAQTQHSVAETYGGPMGRRMPDPLRIVHKDQDQITAFCLNRSAPGLLALSTQKEIQELNIRPLLDACVPWLEEDTEMDILNLRQKHDLAYSTSSYVDFLLVQHPSDRLQTSPGGQAMGRQQPLAPGSSQASQQTPTKQPILTKHHFQGHTNPYFCQIIFERSRQIFMPLKRHKTETVRRLASHPSLPLYLSGGQDGSVVLWEFNHQLPISTPRSPGTFAKVTRVAFNQQGNKFGVADTDGNLSLWQVLAGHSKPYFTYPCHNKTISDFTFLGSSSLVMTAGHSTDHRNVVLWDTLMPTKKCLVSSFGCHEHGAASIVYGPLNQIVITGGKKGEVAIFDMRQRLQRDRFQAHEGSGNSAAVKAIALDPGEEFFATGSADGDIKVWSLTGPTPHQLLFSFPAEHSRSTFFRSMTAGTTGVSQLYIDSSGRLFSCGADGSLKMRHIPTVECQPKWFFAPGSPSTHHALFGSASEGEANGLRANENSFLNGNGVVNSYY